ncbi:MAG: DUF4810 domain-containing protein [Bacteroidales bacterium]|nr:DUF4810 domain-containing protein [Candidatus Liminaster caballi]
MKKYFLSVAMLSCMFLTSCMAPTSLYSWYDYEETTYQYNKKHTDKLQARVLEQYKKIEKQKGLRKVVPPGLYAERGFLLCKIGQTEEGIAFLKKEIEIYPESSKYISRIINQLEK